MFTFKYHFKALHFYLQPQLLTFTLDLHNELPIQQHNVNEREILKIWCVWNTWFSLPTQSSSSPSWWTASPLCLGQKLGGKLSLSPPSHRQPPALQQRLWSLAPLSSPLPAPSLVSLIFERTERAPTPICSAPALSGDEAAPLQTPALSPSDLIQVPLQLLHYQRSFLWWPYPTLSPSVSLTWLTFLRSIHDPGLILFLLAYLYAAVLHPSEYKLCKSKNFVLFCFGVRNISFT